MPSLLLIDDDLQMAELIQDLIQLGGYQCVHAENGKDGLTLAGKYHPDLIILDINMPEMDGWQVYKQLRTFSNIPVIFVTLEYEQAGVMKSEKIGAAGYLNKVHLIGELLPQIKLALNSRPIKM